MIFCLTKGFVQNRRYKEIIRRARVLLRSTMQCNLCVVQIAHETGGTSITGSVLTFRAGQKLQVYVRIYVCIICHLYCGV